MQRIHTYCGFARPALSKIDSMQVVTGLSPSYFPPLLPLK